jgi:hypothetical protein
MEALSINFFLKCMTIVNSEGLSVWQWAGIGTVGALVFLALGFALGRVSHGDVGKKLLDAYNSGADNERRHHTS